MERRCGTLLEAIARLEGRAGELAHAVAHTSGQPVAMAHRETSPVAFARALDALAQAARAMTYPAPPETALPFDRGVSSAGGGWRSEPHGLGLVLASAASPLETSYAGLFASLATGNPVLVKPHPAAILPLAITVRVLREVLAEEDLPVDTVQLCVDSDDAPLGLALAREPAVRIIDYAGDRRFADVLAGAAPQARIHALTPGLNPVVVDGTDDVDGLCRGLARDLTRHAGQTASAPRVVFVPEEGIATDRGFRSFAAVAEGLAGAIDELLGEPARAADGLGAVRAAGAVAAVEACRALGEVVRDAAPVPVAGWPTARTLSPLVVATHAGAEAAYAAPPRVGPVCFVVATDDTAEGIERALNGVARHGAALARIHSTNDQVLEAAADAFTQQGVPVACNVLESRGETPGGEGATAHHAALRRPDFVSSRVQRIYLNDETEPR